MKDKFIELLLSTRRDGIENLLEHLKNTDFFTAPASTQYHGAYEGGLLEHSMAVYENLTTIADAFLTEYDPGSLILLGLLHDVCKTNFYKVSTRNVKDPIIDGQQKYGWHQIPFYMIEDQLPYGHGEKSVLIISQFIKLTREETLAIRWHMGGFDDTAKSYAGGLQLSAAMDKYPLLVMLHMADLAATYLLNKEE